MDFNLNPEQRAIQDMAKAFAAEYFLPSAAEWDEKEVFPEKELRLAAELGLAGIYTSENVGGAGLGRLDAAIIFEELSAACPSTAAYLSIHNMVAWMIDNFANDKLRRRFLPDITNMSKMTSYCLTEPGSGSDAASLTTQAKRQGNSHFVLNGSKSFISGGSTSEIYAVMCRTSEEGADGMSCILVEAGTEGLSFGAKEKKMGWNSQHTAAVHFDNCLVPIDDLVGKEGDGFKIAMAGLDGGRVNIAACSVGGARKALELAKGYSKERKQFGKRLADFQSIQFKIADMTTELEASRLMVHRAASSIDNGEPDVTMHCAMAKRWATEACSKICNDALQIHGGYGYLKDFGIEKIVRDLRVHEILEGTNEIMRLIIARQILN
ncbi:MAG: acyl-CoA dehydrogenase family protein [Pseudomonadota bacterium]|nr:acyl-CoA dehydrogenase family protein [Pseudomonadota bacterium]